MSIMDIGRGGSTSPSQQIQEDSDPATHRVNGYYRKDGTHVDSYIRSNPDGNADNNLKNDKKLLHMVDVSNFLF